jgi:sugar phosphate isomerase/epimerase
MDDAAKYGVGICVENTWPILTSHPLWRTEELIAFVDSLGDSDLVGICWDTGHGNLTGNGHNYQRNANPEFAAYGNQYENITKIGKRLRALHIDDNNGLDDDHIVPGGGTIAWDDVIRALDDIGYEHSFTFEAHHTVMRFPNECKDAAARFLHDVGVALVNTSKNGRVYEN